MSNSMTKEELEKFLKEDQEEQYRQDAHEEHVFTAKVALLYEEPESIVNWTEYDKLIDALCEFKSFCNEYGLDFKIELDNAVECL